MTPGAAGGGRRDSRQVHPACAPAARVSFAHPTEQRFASLLDAFGIRWRYEPVEFTLRWDDAGRPESGFRPDFWLPDHGCFVELTVAEQRLVTKKNGKVRRFRQLYPEIEIVVVYRRRLLDLLAHHGLELPSAAAA